MIWRQFNVRFRMVGAYGPYVVYKYVINSEPPVIRIDNNPVEAMRWRVLDSNPAFVYGRVCEN